MLAVGLGRVSTVHTRPDGGPAAAVLGKIPSTAGTGYCDEGRRVILCGLECALARQGMPAVGWRRIGTTPDLVSKDGTRRGLWPEMADDLYRVSSVVAGTAFGGGSGLCGRWRHWWLCSDGRR